MSCGAPGGAPFRLRGRPNSGRAVPVLRLRSWTRVRSRSPFLTRCGAFAVLFMLADAGALPRRDGRWRRRAAAVWTSPELARFVPGSVKRAATGVCLGLAGEILKERRSGGGDGANRPLHACASRVVRRPCDGSCDSCDSSGARKRPGGLVEHEPGAQTARTTKSGRERLAAPCRSRCDRVLAISEPGGFIIIGWRKRI